MDKRRVQYRQGRQYDGMASNNMSWLHYVVIVRTWAMYNDRVMASSKGAGTTYLPFSSLYCSLIRPVTWAMWVCGCRYEVKIGAR